MISNTGECFRGLATKDYQWPVFFFLEERFNLNDSSPHSPTHWGRHACTHAHTRKILLRLTFNMTHKRYHTSSHTFTYSHSHMNTHTLPLTSLRSERERDTSEVINVSRRRNKKWNQINDFAKWERRWSRIFLELASFEWKQNRSLEIHPPWPRFAGLGSNPGSPIRVKRKAVLVCLVSADLRNICLLKQSTRLCSMGSSYSSWSSSLRVSKPVIV